MNDRLAAADVLDDADAYADAFAAFVEASPSSFHAAYAVAAELAAAGFQMHDERDAWAPIEAGSRGFAVRDGAVIAWRAGAGVWATSPVRILGAHTDSPGFVLKPQPDFEGEGWAQVGVEIYGGPLINSWLDRDLGFAGRLVTRAGVEHLVRTGAVARIPQLAIHLDRGVNSGLELDQQRHTQPIIGALENSSGASVLDLLAEAAEPRITVDNISQRDLAGAPAPTVQGRSAILPGDIAGFDVRLADTQPPARLGSDRELLASPRLDNLSSTFAGLVAMLGAGPASGTIAMFAAFDHEEIGSESRSGACGPFLEEVLGRLRTGLGASADEAAQANARSWCLSADAGHSVHPNYQEKHDPRVRPIAGRGPMLKINAKQRYATDAHGAALWARACDAAGVRTQEFVSNNTVPCGSTIGPLTATRLGIRTVDVGVPLLSMHSARELVHVDDLHGLARAVGAFFAGA